MKYLNKITKELLIQLYLFNNKSARIIADELKVNLKTILCYLKFYKIKVRRTRNTKGINNPFFGKHHTEVTKKKIKDFFIGKKLPLETCKKIAKANRGSKRSEETREKMSKAQQGDKHWNWQGGKTEELYPPTFSQQLKDKIRVRDNFICQLCKVPELELNRRLIVHHIDYDKENCNKDNLISLCNSCHPKVNQNRNYWIDFFKNKINNLIGKINVRL